jgi:hypothetical protein
MSDVTVADGSGAALYERICVRRPYFALQELFEAEPGQVACVVPVEQVSSREEAPLTVAEAGRHLAILGLCAAASAAPDSDRRYYLAREARITWLHTEALQTEERLVAEAEGHFSTTRKASARTLLATETGTPVARYDLDYDVLSAAAFRRLFAHAYRPGTSDGLPGVNPYTKPLPLTEIEGDDQRQSANVVAEVEDCVGHFPDFPTLPVAVLSTAMVDLACQLIDRVIGRPGVRWIPGEGKLTAQQLVTAGQPVKLAAVREERTGDQLTILVTATVDDRSVAELLMRITVADCQ